MKESLFHLSTDRYAISCKQRFPDSGPIENIVLGIHGFAGDIVPFADVKRFCKRMNRRYGKKDPAVQLCAIP